MQSKRIGILRGGFVLFLSAILMLHCSSPAKNSDPEEPGIDQAVPGVNFQPDKAPFKYLSEYAFFLDNQFSPNERVLPYELITPLFTDYASKSRFVWMPEGKSAGWTEDGVFEFPVGTVLIKSFYYPDELSSGEPSEKLLETRLLVRRTQGWDALPYIWLPDRSDAIIKVAGARKPIVMEHSQGDTLRFDYIIPNKNQCKGCHTVGQAFEPIGPKARNLNRLMTYDGIQRNQLQHWIAEGYLTGAPKTSQWPAIADWQDESESLEDRALAYLEVNCGHCHGPDGPANTSGLHLLTDETDPAHLGICKSPVAAGRGSGGLAFDITPGQADSSILVYRMESDDPGIRMPEVGRQVAHREGVELVRNWINEMSGDCAAPD